jgi:N-acetylglucosaminyldiphosphoundecaprenol N-acetyl-beta-D-mannosaminyltransferase
MHFLSLDIYNGTYQNFFDRIRNPDQKTLVFTPNPEILLRASRDAEFLEILKKANYLTPDAHGLYTASLIQSGKSFFMACIMTFFYQKYLAKYYGEKISGSDLTHDLVQYAIATNQKIMIIDNYKILEPKNNFEIQKKIIQESFPQLISEKLPGLDWIIVFDGEKTPSQLAELIRQKDIRYVFSCIGMKTQEERLVQIFWHLKPEQNIVGLWVWSSFDYLLGLQKRAPKIFRKLWIEWIYRLILQPRLRWQRILDAFWRFPKMLREQR